MSSTCSTKLDKYTKLDTLAPCTASDCALCSAFENTLKITHSSCFSLIDWLCTTTLSPQARYANIIIIYMCIYIYIYPWRDTERNRECSVWTTLVVEKKKTLIYLWWVWIFVFACEWFALEARQDTPLLSWPSCSHTHWEGFTVCEPSEVTFKLIMHYNVKLDGVTMYLAWWGHDLGRKVATLHVQRHTNRIQPSRNKCLFESQTSALQGVLEYAIQHFTQWLLESELCGPRRSHWHQKCSRGMFVVLVSLPIVLGAPKSFEI